MRLLDKSSPWRKAGALIHANGALIKRGNLQPKGHWREQLAAKRQTFTHKIDPQTAPS